MLTADASNQPEVIAAPAEGAAPAPAIYTVLADAMIAVEKVGKNGYNEHGRYQFRGIDDVINAVGPILRKLRIVPVPQLQTINARDVVTSKGKPSKETTVRVVYRFYGPAGDYIDVEVPGESMDSSDKGTAQAMSVAYRIALLQLLCIPTGDPDPDSFQPERGGGRQQARPAPREFRPGAEAQELMASINAVAHQGAAGRVWARVVEAVKAGAITEAEGRWLRARAEERAPELPPDPDAADETTETPAALEGELIEGATE